MSQFNSEADGLLRNPLLVALFADIEKSALEMAVNAKLGDDETRRNALAEVRAIRSVRMKLSLGAQGRATLPGDTNA